MKARFRPLEHRSERCAEPRGTGGAGRWTPVQAGAGPRGAVPAREGRRGLEVKVPLVEPFTRPLPRDFAQDGVDVHLTQVDPGEMA